ncbi:hypothetical protein K461DRAFT_315469 [Myriangium duriaei CBS 260.36]|uniref:Uncharacterized protein n=1 Tax=Myriangium duriaei CBS 260.36 TaxID=1168546 RepID=A0A9P4IVW1_9PEZI|nr:hypothetical protein K461DRAFT_315469 [Myriangium duriaei CBS 260.36]
MASLSMDSPHRSSLLSLSIVCFFFVSLAITPSKEGIKQKCKASSQSSQSSDNVHEAPEVTLLLQIQSGNQAMKDLQQHIDSLKVGLGHIVLELEGITFEQSCLDMECRRLYELSLIVTHLKREAKGLLWLQSTMNLARTAQMILPEHRFQRSGPEFSHHAQFHRLPDLLDPLLRQVHELKDFLRDLNTSVAGLEQPSTPATRQSLKAVRFMLQENDQHFKRLQEEIRQGFGDEPWSTMDTRDMHPDHIKWLASKHTIRVEAEKLAATHSELRQKLAEYLKESDVTWSV